MTSLLDSRDKIAKLDQHNMLSSIEALPDQLRDAWKQASGIEFPLEYKQASNIIIAGMGGSALGTKVIKHLYKDSLSVPIEVYSHYQLPAYAGSNSLVLLSSYSGTTEEVLAAAEQARELGCMIAVIAAGGKLIELAKANNWPHYQIEPKFNPSNQPRMAIGYAVVGQLAIFGTLEYISITKEEITNLSDSITTLSASLSPDIVDGNIAKLLAYHAYDKSLVLTGAEHLIGAVHVLNNQLNENAKVLTSEWHLPELNHHYMEALTNPKKLREDVLFLVFNSELYLPAVAKRATLTAEVIRKAGYEAELLQSTADSKLGQIFELITLGAYFNFYLAMLYGLDPAPIPNVDWFKAEMKK